MCHGQDAKGTGSVLNILRDSYNYSTLVTPDLTTLTPAGIEAFLAPTTRPFGADSVMPPFGRLLSAEERKAISAYVGALPE